MSELVLHGKGQKTLSVKDGCLYLELHKISHQVRVIPIKHISCVEISQPQDDHRGYIYFRTPMANKPIKASVVGRDINADDDMVFFDEPGSYEIAVAIQEYIAAWYSR